jgi:hypothetical protein
MAGRMLEVDEIMAILHTTVARIGELTDGMTAARLHGGPAPDEWSVNDVLAHLRACNDVLGGNMRRILTEDRPVWRAMNPRTWQKKSGYHDLRFGQSFDDFASQRAALLALLEPQPREAWDRTASVTVPPKKIFEYSVRYYGDWLAAHERAHLRHLPKIIEAAELLHPPDERS